MEIKVLNLKSLGFKWGDAISFVEPWKVIVDRSSALGNPFHSGNRKKDILDFKRKLWAELNLESRTPMIEEIYRLLDLYIEGSTLELYCWCTPLPCHANVIRHCIEWLSANGCYF